VTLRFNLKIRSLTFMVACVLAVFAGITVFSNYYINSQMSSVRYNWQNFLKGPAEKSIILSNLRNALGYGGMIHNFKNFVLRKDRNLILKVELDILRVTVLLTAYQNIGLNSREKAAIGILDSRLTKYAEFISVAEKMARDGRSSKDIDAAVGINDELAIGAMLLLVDELNQAYAEESERVERAVTEVNQRTQDIIIVSLVLAILSIGFTIWFMYGRVLVPMKLLGKSMEEISRKNTSHPIAGINRKDEIGDMARTVEVFRKVMAERKSFEASLIEAREIAESSNRAKTDFLANMSHELRTPLNGIIGLSEMIREGTFGPLGNEKYAEYIDEIHKSGGHLLALVQNILNVSEVESKSVTLEESDVDLASLIGDSVAEISAEAQYWKIQVHNQAAKSKIPVRVDAVRIKQVFINILTNAIRFTPEGGTITIDAFYEEDGAVAVSITDTGIGMARGAIEKALSPFGQVDRGTFAKHQGTGLGLYLSRLLVEMHDGELKIKSSLGGGTRVTIRLPAARVID
jgi:signal transduction histidine kinase